MVDYSYVAEIFTAFYSMDRYEVALTMNRIFGAYAWVFWGTIVFNVLQIQLLWFARVRASHAALFLISLGVLVGMWLERFMLIVTSLYQDYHALELGHVLSDLLGYRLSCRLDRAVFCVVSALRAPGTRGIDV